MNTHPHAEPISHDPFARTILSHIRLAVLDSRCFFIWVNDKFCKLTAYQEQELLGKSIKDLNLVGLCPSEFRQIQSVIMSGHIWSGEIPSKTKPGEILWVKLTILPVKDTSGNITSYIVLSSNVTEVRNALKEKNDALANLILSEARYRALIENQTDLISLCDGNGIRLFVNESYCTFVGKTQDELIGTHILELPLPGLSAEIIKRVFELTPQQSEISGVVELENAAHKKVWISFSVRGIFDSQGRLCEVLTIGRDVTILKMAELHLSKYIDDLERIAFITSHRVRAPIVTMKGLLELLRLNAFDSNQWSRVLTEFQKCVDNLDQHTSELGNFVNHRQYVSEKNLTKTIVEDNTRSGDLHPPIPDGRF